MRLCARRWWARGASMAVVVSVWGCTGSGSDQGSESLTPVLLPERIAAQVLPESPWTGDTWEIVMCRIPLTTQDPIYADLDLRLELSVDQVSVMIAPVADYFDRWSDGLYDMRFIRGSDITLESQDTTQTCIDRSLDASAQWATGVIVIADAAHRHDAPGGWTQPGHECAPDAAPCPASRTRRAVYLGGADFFPSDSGGRTEVTTALDLVEHEIGHAFGWPHSGRSKTPTSAVGGAYDSVIDLMSNSAAARQSDSSRQHGPGVLAFHQLSAGWLDPALVDFVAGDDQRRLERTVAADISGIDQVRVDSDHPRLIMIEIAEHAVITVEVRIDAGDNEHLKSSGVAVHLIEWGPEVCPVPDADGLCVGVDRRVTLLGDGPDGLTDVDQTVIVGDVSVTVVAFDAERATAGVVIARR